MAALLHIIVPAILPTWRCTCPIRRSRAGGMPRVFAVEVSWYVVWVWWDFVGGTRSASVGAALRVLSLVPKWLRLVVIPSI